MKKTLGLVNHLANNNNVKSRSPRFMLYFVKELHELRRAGAHENLSPLLREDKALMSMAVMGSHAFPTLIIS